MEAALAWACIAARGNGSLVLKEDVEDRSIKLNSEACRTILSAQNHSKSTKFDRTALSNTIR